MFKITSIETSSKATTLTLNGSMWYHIDPTKIHLHYRRKDIPKRRHMYKFKTHVHEKKKQIHTIKGSLLFFLIYNFYKKNILKIF